MRKSGVESFEKLKGIFRPFSLEILCKYGLLEILHKYGPLRTATAFMSISASLFMISGHDTKEIVRTARRIALYLEQQKQRGVA